MRGAEARAEPGPDAREAAAGRVVADAGARGVAVRVLVDSLHGFQGSFGFTNPLLTRPGSRPSWSAQSSTWRARRRYPEAVLQIIAVVHVLLAISLMGLILMHSGRDTGFGGMGFAVCGVLGAQLAAPERPCVSVCGDGGFLMTPHVLATAVEYGIPAVWIVWNNYGYVSIRDLQLGFFGGREFATSFAIESTGELYSPDFVTLAGASGFAAALAAAWFLVGREVITATPAAQVRGLPL